MSDKPEAKFKESAKTTLKNVHNNTLSLALRKCQMRSETS